MSSTRASSKPIDVVLIGAGIMSATLAVLLRELDPELTIEVFERLDGAAAESSDAWNNAGTGHSGFCELNYTPEKEDGTVDVSKAIQIAEQFELTKQFWSSLVATGKLADPWRFVRNVPHLSFVRGDKDISYLRTRHANLVSSPLFERMEYTEDPELIATWVPLVMDGADPRVPVAATRMAAGTDVNFGSLTRSLLRSLVSTQGTGIHLGHEVGDIRRDGDEWVIQVRDLKADAKREIRARFLFIGAGGYSLTLLERTGIPEAEGYGAFPVSGQWLRCTNHAVIARHCGKVYGKAELGAPPMSVPHLDTRWIGTGAVRAPGHEEFGPMSTMPQQQLLFGPYAGITTRFLKKGSWLDLLKSIGIDNVRGVIDAGLSNFDLTKYLIGQALLEPEERLAVLRTYCPSAELEDWELQIAGLRVQIIKSDGKGGGVLKFGTEVVTSADGTVAALLGASPGASTAVSVMLEVMERCFPERWKSDAWQAGLHRLMPTFGKPLHKNAELCRGLRAQWSAQ